MKTSPRRLFIIVGSALLLAGCAAPASRWEYRTRTTDNPKGKSVLDGYGKDGWELVNCTYRPKDQTGTNFVYEYYFKRAKK